MTGMRGALIGFAAALALAGCGSTSIGGAGGARSQRPLHPVNQLPILHPLSPDQVAQGLINAAHPPPGAVPATTAPTRSLRYPPEIPMASGQIVRYRWWRVSLPWRAAYSWVSRHQPPYLHSDSSGASSGPALGDNEKNIDFTPSSQPLSVNSATLTIAVAPLTATTSAIGAYAVVIKQPLRPATENVPLTVDTVTVSARRAVSSQGRGGLISNRIVSGTQAQILVRDFDALSVRPSGPVNCPLSMTTESATFRANGHVWTATTGTCVGVDVTVDGQPAPTLNDSLRFDRDLSAALADAVRQPIMTTTPVR